MKLNNIIEYSIEMFEYGRSIYVMYMGINGLFYWLLDRTGSQNHIPYHCTQGFFYYINEHIQNVFICAMELITEYLS